MGSGKSSIGKLLAQKYDTTFIDLDDYIIKKHNMSVSLIFEKHGEPYFRKIETDALSEVISMPNTIISLGGGTPCFDQNAKLIFNNSRSITVFLNPEINTLAQRLWTRKEKRPIISKFNSINDLLVFMQDHLGGRMSFYNQADCTISHAESKEEELIQIETYLNFRLR